MVGGRSTHNDSVKAPPQVANANRAGPMCMQQISSNLIAEHSYAERCNTLPMQIAATPQLSLCRLLQHFSSNRTPLPMQIAALNGMLRSGDIVIQANAPNFLSPFALPSQTPEAMNYSFSYHQLTPEICAHTQALSTKCEYNTYCIYIYTRIYIYWNVNNCITYTRYRSITSSQSGWGHIIIILDKASTYNTTNTYVHQKEQLKQTKQSPNRLYTSSNWY